MCRLFEMSLYEYASIWKVNAQSNHKGYLGVTVVGSVKR